ncbi:MAG TPA: spore coat protein CotJB [Candidatus Blautia faecavium]|uniref:Spore coat protein CotJB n=1 Tax=Candidatus Blautia faecavium TaxID=2838487 RepID=A0A9D2LWA0_9FIRM|nr:spore coat protein CotJB [Candidatus Blautia faecavium]
MTCRQPQSKRQQLLSRINEVSFAVDDILLYLDTHPTDEKALAFANTHMAERQKLMAEYEQSYGPLTPKDPACPMDSWKWAQQPFPWEREGGCR